MTDTVDSLDVLEPRPIGVSYRGETLEIRPLTVGQLPKLVRAARPVIDAVLALDALPEEDNAGALVDLVLDLVEQHGESVLAAAAICSGKSEAWIEGGDTAEFIALAQKIFEVNRDFFVQRLGPLLAGRAEVEAGVGPTASSS